jgi:hypothetical protein
MIRCGPSFGLCGLRVTLLDDLGNVEAGDNSYVTDKQISFAFSPNIDTGNTFSQRNGCGCSLSRFKAEDIFNWWEFTFTDGAVEPALTTLMVGGVTITDPAEGSGIVGQHFPTALDCNEQARMVAVEIWTQHLFGSKKDSSLPYIHWVFPASVWQFSDNTAQEDYMNPVLTGFSRSNDLWGSGPYGDGPPDGSDVGMEGAYWKTADTIPDADCAVSAVTPGS